MVDLVGAIPQIQELLGHPIIVGGLAVMSRLGGAYRATQDLGALRLRAAGEVSGLEVLRSAGATDINEVGGFLPTERGSVRVDVLEAGQHDLDREFSDPTDRLEAMAHKWALDTATLMLIVATELDAMRDRGGHNEAPAETRAIALVARPGPLVAMKLKASVDRSSVKEATDLLDVVRLVTDRATVEQVLSDFERADPQLVADVVQHAKLQFVTNRLKTRRAIRDLGSNAVPPELIEAAASIFEGMS